MENRAAASNDDLMDIDQSISAGASNNISRIGALSVLVCTNLLNAIQIILEHKPQRTNNEMLTEQQADVFEMIMEQKDPQVMLDNTRRFVAKFFDIHLGIICFRSGEFTLVMDCAHHKDADVAYLLLNEDNTVCGPLCDVDASNSKQTVFDSDDWSVELNVKMYINGLNHQRQFMSSVRPSVQHHDTSAQDLSTCTPVAEDVLKQAFDHTRQLAHCVGFNLTRFWPDLPPNQVSVNRRAAIASIVDILKLVIAYIPCLDDPAQIGELSISNTNRDPEATDAALPSVRSPRPSNGSIHASDKTRRNGQPDTAPLRYDAPKLQGKLTRVRRARTLKDFASSGSAPVRTEGSSQRDALHIEVPKPDETSLCLAVTVYTHDNLDHPSKIVVPDKTKVDLGDLSVANDLRCLNFDDNAPGDHFVIEERTVFSEITPEERRSLNKEIHVINLYQRGSINQHRVKVQGLKTGKLVMWFATFENGNYERVSSMFFSDPFKEK